MGLTAPFNKGKARLKKFLLSSQAIMVNIQAIIYIGDVARLFGSLESYRAFCYQGATPAQTAQKQQLKVQAGIAEHQFAIAYNCDPALMKGVVACFGTIREARRRLRELHIRHLLCNHANQVILQIRRLPGDTYHIVLTIFRPFDVEVVQTIINGPEVTGVGPEFEP